MAEDLTDYLLENGVRVRYLHSEVDTLRPVELLRELRLGEFDVLVGINLLREGLDLPEVSLVSILDADKETSCALNAASSRPSDGPRNVSGQVHVRADKITPSMRTAIDETNRRRAKQTAYNTSRWASTRNRSVRRSPDITDLLSREDADTQELLARFRPGLSRGVGPKAPAADVGRHAASLASMPAQDLTDLIEQLTQAMHNAAEELQFEVAARYRDEVAELKKELRGMQDVRS